jgi:hypothetical protein
MKYAAVIISVAMFAKYAMTACPILCYSPPAPYPYSAGPIQLIANTGICAMPPGLLATDGCDDVCTLATCCEDWGTNNGGVVTLPNEVNVDCPSVNCGNVCRMACERAADTVEACNKICGGTNIGDAYVFRRLGFCFNGFALPTAPTHVGFGFEVSKGVFLFGSLENGGGSPLVSPDDDNGFWMATGTLSQMFATFREPCESCFHGAIGTSGYAEYRTYSVPNPFICEATYFAESLYSVGYAVATNNCLDAVYNVLSKYGVGFTSGHSPSDILCPGSWFEALPAGPLEWGPIQPIPMSGAPVQAVPCPSSIPSSCAPPSGNCPTTIGPIGPAACASLPGVQNVVDCLMQAVVKSASYQAGDLLYCTDPLGGLLCDKTTFPNAAYWCDYCMADMTRTIDGSCFNTWFDTPNQGYCAATVTCPNPD